MPRRIAVLLTCHNRRATTLSALQCLFAQTLSPDVQLQGFVVDDGSTDGTADAVRSQFPGVTVLAGGGSLYWNRGMRLAFEQAMRDDFDSYLWLNDDTRLYPDAIARLMATRTWLLQHGHRKTVVVGSTQDPVTGALTYGGVLRCSRMHPFRYRLVEPGPTPRPCQTMNGNCVLVPRSVAQVVGNLSTAFTHSMGDFDYGLRCRQAGCGLWIAPGFVGTCARNPVENTWMDPRVPLHLCWRDMLGPKGLPLREWCAFARRHGGLAWPLFWILPYLRMTFSKVRLGSI